MKKNIFILGVLLFASTALYSKSDIRFLSSYILPIENSAINQSLVLGFGAGFWGVFEFTGNAYLEIDPTKEEFFSKFQQPNVVSGGVAMNIPMGGFSLKGDYQRLFSFKTVESELSLSKYSDSYKIGIGIDLSRDVELEVYHRTLLDSSDDFIKGDKQGFIGVGLNIEL